MKPFKNQQMRDKAWDGMPEERRREIAYHEAGHAVMFFFFGESIDGINMRGSVNFAAMVKKRAMALYGHVAHMRSTALHSLAKATAARECMINLAGPCAAHIFNGGTSEWLDELFEDHWDEELIDNTDLTKTIKMAKALHDTPGRQQQFINRMAQWTEEALSMPHLWRLVEALGERLNTQKSMTGDSALRIMQKAWGDRGSLPFYEDPKWKRRLAPKIASGSTEAAGE